MSRFNNVGIGLASSITDAPHPPIEIGPSTQNGTPTDDKAGYSLTGEDGDTATTQLDVVLVAGQHLPLVNGGGNGYTDGTFTGKGKGSAANDIDNTQNLQTGQDRNNAGGLTVDYTIEYNQVVSCTVNNPGGGHVSGDSFVINGSAGDTLNPPAVFMIP